MDNKGVIEKYVDAEIAAQLVKFIANFLEIRAKAVVLGAQAIAKYIAKMDGSRTVSEDSETRLYRMFRWSNPEEQTNQAITFYPVFPAAGGSFDVTCTVLGRTVNGARDSVACTMHIDNPA